MSPAKNPTYSTAYSSNKKPDNNSNFNFNSNNESMTSETNAAGTSFNQLNASGAKL